MVRDQAKLLSSALLLRRPLAGVSTRISHLVGSPTLHDLYIKAAVMTGSPTTAGTAIMGEDVVRLEEYEEVRDRLAERWSASQRRYPDFCPMGTGTAYLLYMLVRRVRPSLTVEVGVADGVSTAVILSALDANAHGRLVSVDVDADAGVIAARHPRWRLRTHRPKDLRSRQLRNLLAEIGPPDLFFHDAMHTYYAQYGEFCAALDHMQTGGVFISDDVDHSWAFVDLVNSRQVEPVVLVDGRKAVGAFRTLQ